MSPEPRGIRMYAMAITPTTAMIAKRPESTSSGFQRTVIGLISLGSWCRTATVVVSPGRSTFQVGGADHDARRWKTRGRTQPDSLRRPRPVAGRPAQTDDTPGAGSGPRGGSAGTTDSTGEGRATWECGLREGGGGGVLPRYLDEVAILCR